MSREEECVEEVGCCWEMGRGIPGEKLLVGMGREGNDWRKGCWKKMVRELLVGVGKGNAWRKGACGRWEGEGMTGGKKGCR
jgi:hypothetical protein